MNHPTPTQARRQRERHERLAAYVPADPEIEAAIQLVEAFGKSYHRFMLNPDSIRLSMDLEENRRVVRRALEGLQSKDRR